MKKNFKAQKNGHAGIDILCKAEELQEMIMFQEKNMKIHDLWRQKRMHRWESMVAFLYEQGAML